MKSKNIDETLELAIQNHKEKIMKISIFALTSDSCKIIGAGEGN